MVLADALGSVVWGGGFEPFGADWSGAGDAGLGLRLPGQWWDGSWEEAGLAAGLLQNVYRWYESTSGRYNRSDPLQMQRAHFRYTYAGANPTLYLDPLGLRCQLGPQWNTCLTRIFGAPVGQIEVLDNTALPQMFTGNMAFTLPGTIFIPGKCSEFWDDWYLVLHEYYHAVDQWGSGRLTLSSYLAESGYQWIRGRDPYSQNRFEREAKDFAIIHRKQFRECLNCATPPADPKPFVGNICPPDVHGRTHGMVPSACN